MRRFTADALRCRSERPQTDSLKPLVTGRAMRSRRCARHGATMPDQLESDGGHDEAHRSTGVDRHFPPTMGYRFDSPCCPSILV